MTREQFREKVWPFKDILPRKMCDDVLWYFLMPDLHPSQFHPRLKTIDSKLITLKHASLIATWIDRKEGKPYKHTDIPYDFTLLMRGSRDGYSQQTLHQRCGGQAKTIMLMKIKSTEEIFGMYISNIWSNTSSARSHDSFMFSFGEGRDTKDPVLSRVRAAGYDLALSRGQERGMDELEMFKISPKTVFML
ncbi:7801_t:CDS:1 [Dentiscutata heterogama]|uniref:7801_t:CDS:1 n=1 Tax=Dentiscutata heterogama TaxID=1316150 RepID=A0ACA9L135_9GLOM|nr:7801_t:CDS:1 [Dentiscutata heterogama]